MTQKNHIDNDRLELKKYFSEENRLPETTEIVFSPSRKYKIVKNEYRQTKKDLNWIASKIQIFNSNEISQLEILIDNPHFFHTFLNVKDVEYLLFSEVLCGGNSFVNLDDKTFKGFSDGTDGFISTKYLISPDNERLAVVGCFWAGPTFIRVFNVSRLETLPWPIVQDIKLIDDGELELKWLNFRKLEIIEYSEKNVIQKVEVEIK